ncbi:MAG TPA: N-6 DNA methylase [Candidatus Cybelea sp.]|jgi:type I restriction enzyme M protein|nr:N-6 DNA methylase [Candidatus Cybelea sp.]
MAKANKEKAANGSVLESAAQLWAPTDSFRADLHPELKTDFILANPPFNVSDWGGENLRSNVRWKFGAQPLNAANYA